MSGRVDTLLLSLSIAHEHDSFTAVSVFWSDHICMNRKSSGERDPFNVLARQYLHSNSHSMFAQRHHHALYHFARVIRIS